MQNGNGGALRWMILVAMWTIATMSCAQDSDAGGYRIQPGDALRVSVWKEQDLQQDLLVSPDGSFSFPLAGRIVAGGQTVGAVTEALRTRIEEFIPDALVTVQILQTEGNTIYVLGKVNRPGAYVMSRTLDVTQALALAGGMATFAQEGDILILRRQGGQQSVYEFDYSAVEQGEDLGTNLLLQAGDVIVVP